MGSALSKLGGSTTILMNYVRGNTSSPRKRKHDSMSGGSSDEDMERVIDIALHTPKRKRMESTVAYIYQALFIEGRDSDVTVVALGQEWPLHRVYLSQSAYFASMFGGGWRESQQAVVHIDVVDPLITVAALRTVLGALYSDEVHLEPMGVVGVMAAAAMLQLGSLSERCAEVMLETLNPCTALQYYDAASRYGDTRLRTGCERWFLLNLMTYYGEDGRRLRELPQALLERLVAHPDLCVLKTEITLYVLLTHWTYMQVHPEAAGGDAADADVDDGGSEVAQAQEYFSARRSSGEPAFLDSPEGARYRPLYRGLRVQHLVSHHLDVELVQRDHVLPADWLHGAVMAGWRATLLVNENEERGPAKSEGDDTLFLRNALRCGRVLPAKDRHIWRWTGFHYGLDLVMVADERGLAVKRNHRPEFEQLLSLQTTRHVQIRVTAYALNEQRQVRAEYGSGVRHLSLGRSEDAALLTFPQDVTFPLLISANVLFTTPTQTST